MRRRSRVPRRRRPRMIRRKSRSGTPFQDRCLREKLRSSSKKGPAGPWGPGPRVVISPSRGRVGGDRRRARIGRHEDGWSRPKLRRARGLGGLISSSSHRRSPTAVPIFSLIMQYYDYAFLSRVIVRPILSAPQFARSLASVVFTLVDGGPGGSSAPESSPLCGTRLRFYPTATMSLIKTSFPSDKNVRL